MSCVCSHVCGVSACHEPLLPEFRVPVKGDEIRWRVLDKLLGCADSFYGELKKRIGPVKKAGEMRKLSPW